MKLTHLARSLAVLPLALALTQCDKVKAMFEPKPSPYAFDVDLRMSPKAEAALKQSDSGGLYVKASYYGVAKPDYRGKADKMNRLYLGDETWTYSGNARRIHLKGEPIDTKVLPHTTDGQPYVLLTIKGLVGGPDDANPLACHTYIGTVQGAQAQPQVLDCEFDSERYWDKANAESSSQ